MRSAAFPLALLLIIAGCSGQKPPPPPPPTVTAATPLTRDITDWDDYTGRFEAPQDVEVRARATGSITRVLFRNGQDVHVGQPLFEIDRRPYAAAYEQAVAQVQRARAALLNAQQRERRTQQLLTAQAVSKEEAENDVATARSATADLAAAQAAAHAAKVKLDYTIARAPFSGRVSDRRVNVGDAVTDGTTVLTRVVSLDPIWFVFEGAESFYLKNLRQDERGERGSSRYTANPIEIQLADETGYRWKGRMTFLDNAIDESSGTIRAKAVVPNPTRFLTPGMYGRARLLGSGSYRAMLVPDEAIITDQTRKLVYVVGRDSKAAQRVVQIGPLVEGLRVIREGLTPGDLVVIDGAGRLQPNSPVTVQKGKVAPKPGADAAPNSQPLSTPPSAEAQPAGHS